MWTGKAPWATPSRCSEACGKNNLTSSARRRHAFPILQRSNLFGSDGQENHPVPSGEPSIVVLDAADTQNVHSEEDVGNVDEVVDGLEAEPEGKLDEAVSVDADGVEHLNGNEDVDCDCSMITSVVIAMFGDRDGR